MKLSKFKISRLNLKNPKIKKGIIIALPVVFALTAAVSLALLLKPDKMPEAPSGDSLDGTKPKDDVEVIAPVETPAEKGSVGLGFRSNNNGTCAVVGIGSCTDKIVVIPAKSPSGDVVTELSVGAFADLSDVVEILIPDTVITIGSGAFSNCKKLEYISVGEANPLFTSDGGVLYNKAMSTLICYPSGKTDTVYVLPKSIARIGEGAFSYCPYLREIKFVGSKAAFNAVYIAGGNTALDLITISCSSSDK